MARRIIILGGPRVGKTTLSQKLKSELGIPSHHSDDLKHLDWSEQSAEAAKWFSDSGDWVCEGVQMARGLRKWLLANPDTQLDVDILRLSHPYEMLLDGQVSMTKGIETVFREVEGELTRRGARIHELSDPSEAFNLQWDTEDNHKAGGLMAFKKTLTKIEWDALPEEKRKIYTDEKLYVPDGENWKLGEVEGVEDVSGLKTALQKERDARTQLDNDLKALKAQISELGEIEDLKKLKADAAQRVQDNLKKSGEWDKWKESFETQKAKDLKTWEDKYVALEKEHKKLLLEDKLRTFAIEGGVRKESIDRAMRDLLHPDAPRARLTEQKAIEILGLDGNPLALKPDSFFKDVYIQEAPEYYPPTTGGTGSQQSQGVNGSRRKVIRSEWEKLPAEQQSAVMADVRAGKAELAEV